MSDSETLAASTITAEQFPVVYVSSESDTLSNPTASVTVSSNQPSTRSSQLLLLDALWSEPEAEELPTSNDLWEDELFDESDYDISSLDSAFEAILEEVAA